MVFSMECRRMAVVLLVLCSLALVSLTARAEMFIVPTMKRAKLLSGASPQNLSYHKGPLLAGLGPIKVYPLWYGNFTPAQKSIVADFLSSLHVRNPANQTVMRWWSNMRAYKDASGAGVGRHVKLGKEVNDASYSLGKSLKRDSMGLLVSKALEKRDFHFEPKGIYMVFTSADVIIQDFCMSSCGFHDVLNLSANARVPIAWVGNSDLQCPGYCAWPFAYPGFGPASSPLIPPNGDVGMDGMIINIGMILAGMASNPFGTGYYENDTYVSLEAGTGCAGIFGPHAYPGYAGDLLMDKKTNASYNAYGINGRTYLLTALWSLHNASCRTTLD